MSITNKIIFLMGVGLFSAIAVAQEVSHRDAGKITLNATPVAIGSGTDRIELFVSNTGSNSIVCGYDNSTLSDSAGAGTGSRILVGGGWIKCQFPNIEYYCLSASGSEVSYDQAAMATPTPTP